MLSVEDVRKRVDRLEKLSMGLALEKCIVRKGDDPLLRLERVRYLSAIRKRQRLSRPTRGPASRPPASCWPGR